MKLTMIFVAILFLAACVEEGSDQTDTMTAICIDGVQYWLDGIGQMQMMAPRIDPETLTFVRCE